VLHDPAIVRLSHDKVDFPARWPVPSLGSPRRSHVQDTTMNHSRRSLTLKSCLLALTLVTAVPIIGCGDPQTGTIKAPSREEMQPGADTGVEGKAAKKADQVKTIGPGAKKF
jgi:hypothetical protein